MNAASKLTDLNGAGAPILPKHATYHQEAPSDCNTVGYEHLDHPWVQNVRHPDHSLKPSLVSGEIQTIW